MSSELHTHIISFDVPYPADYGGVIDVFYKLKALQAAGVKVHLHCFEYGRPPQQEIHRYCEEVYYYSRQNAKSMLFNTLPYIVLSRQSEELKRRLLKDNFPILFEGLHSTFYLPDADLATRHKVVRTHNVEHDYYESLAAVEKNIFKRYYFFNEAGKLKKYQNILKNAQGIAAISPNDSRYFSSLFSGVSFIPAFHPYDQVDIRPGKDEFAFYHGNLGVGENNEAALFLVRKVFNDLPFHLIIAGTKPSEELRKAVKEYKNVTLFSDRSPEEIRELIATAQCNILPTFQATGIKLKLLAALFGGRYCIVNSPMVVNTGLESLCIIADTADEMKKQVELVMKKKDFSDRKKREEVLANFSNAMNAEKLKMLLFPKDQD
ncbi:MAG: glycosyltransferase family 4 protein [Bacteroidetes bacterium]|nr:glycosyltransferase family 4 protein [Bacteroidota bacterium]